MQNDGETELSCSYYVTDEWGEMKESYMTQLINL